jgi:hypothetical protein
MLVHMRPNDFTRFELSEQQRLELRLLEIAPEGASFYATAKCAEIERVGKINADGLYSLEDLSISIPVLPAGATS